MCSNLIPNTTCYELFLADAYWYFNLITIIDSRLSTKDTTWYYYWLLIYLYLIILQFLFDPNITFYIPNEIKWSLILRRMAPINDRSVLSGCSWSLTHCVCWLTDFTFTGWQHGSPLCSSIWFHVVCQGQFLNKSFTVFQTDVMSLQLHKKNRCEADNRLFLCAYLHRLCISLSIFSASVTFTLEDISISICSFFVTIDGIFWCYISSLRGVLDWV